MERDNRSNKVGDVDSGLGPVYPLLPLSSSKSMVSLWSRYKRIQDITRKPI